jgi:hypothetical protein
LRWIQRIRKGEVDALNKLKKKPSEASLKASLTQIKTPKKPPRSKFSWKSKKKYGIGELKSHHIVVYTNIIKTYI